MKENRYPRISLRLIAFSAIMIFLLIAINFFYIRDIKRLTIVIEEILDHPYMVSNSVKDIEIYIHAMHRSMKDVALAKDQEQLLKAVKIVDRYEQQVYEKFKIVSERFLGDMRIVDEAYSAFSDWKPIREEVINLVGQGRFEEAAEITKGKGAEHVEMLITNAQAMIEFANSKAKYFSEHSVHVMLNANRKLLVLAVITIVSGIVSILWIINGVHQPIQNIINRIKGISGDRISGDPSISNRNKLAILNFAISELENRGKTLEKNIAQRNSELNETRKLLEYAIENASVGMVMLDFEGNFMNVNKSFSTCIGYSKDELLIMKFHDILLKENSQKEIEFSRKFISGKKQGEIIEKPLVHKSGVIVYCSITSSVVRDSRDNPMYLFVQVLDITKQKNYEFELKRHRKELELTVSKRTKELQNKSVKLEKSRMALTYLLEDVNEIREQLERSNTRLMNANDEMEAFAYSVSHDLRAPLRAIDGYSQIILEDYNDLLDDEVKELFSVIIENVVKMRQLIDDILSLSRLGRKDLNITQIHLAELIQKLSMEFTIENPNRNITWKIQELPDIYGDPGMINQLFVNLISNAVKFSSTRDKTIITIGTKSTDNQTLFFIRDNGIGFNMKYAGKLFEVFHRLHTDDEFEGTGIGLAIVKRIVQRHNGSIYADSKINTGTTFYFTLNVNVNEKSHVKIRNEMTTA